MTSPLPPILLVGAGRMGSALLAGWRNAGLTSAVVVEPSMTTSQTDDIHIVNDIADITVSFVPTIVVIAVKPQVAANVLPAYERFAGSATFLSIMAGQTIAGIGAKLGAPSARIVRSMPNTPAAIGRGVSVACAGTGVTAEARAVCDRLLAAAGAVAWVDDEAMLDAVTAVSGSGPAYVFLLAELMEQAALDEGLAARPRPPAGPADRRRIGRVAGRFGRGRVGAARGRHQPRRHHRGRDGGADGDRRVARLDASRHQSRDRAVTRARPVGKIRVAPAGVPAPPDYVAPMDDTIFDRALIRSAFDLAALDGWPAVTVAKACRFAGLDLARARARFPMKASILAKFSQMADQTALRDIANDGLARDRLFDMLMRRIDAHQEHRDGVIAVLEAARADPGLGVFLAMTAGSGLRWMLDGAGIETTGIRGALRLHGLVAVWLMTLRAWRNDDSPDLSSTMSTLEESLNRADRAEHWMGGRNTPPPVDDAAFEVPAASAGMPAPPLAPQPIDEPGLDEPSGLQALSGRAAAAAGRAGRSRGLICRPPDAGLHEREPAATQDERKPKSCPTASRRWPSVDFTKIFADMKMPAMPDMEAFMSAHRRNMETLSAANRVALEGAQAVARRHWRSCSRRWAR